MKGVSQKISKNFRDTDIRLSRSWFIFEKMPEENLGDS